MKQNHNKTTSFQLLLAGVSCVALLSACDTLRKTKDSIMGERSDQSTVGLGQRRPPMLNGVHAPAAQPQSAKTQPAATRQAAASPDRNPYDYYDEKGNVAPQKEASDSQNPVSDFFDRMVAGKDSKAQARKALPGNPNAAAVAAAPVPLVASAPAVKETQSQTVASSPAPVAEPVAESAAPSAPQPETPRESWFARTFGSHKEAQAADTSAAPEENPAQPAGELAPAAAAEPAITAPQQPQAEPARESWFSRMFSRSKESAADKPENAAEEPSKDSVPAADAPAELKPQTSLTEPDAKPALAAEEAPKETVLAETGGVPHVQQPQPMLGETVEPVAAAQEAVPAAENTHAEAKTQTTAALPESQPASPSVTLADSSPVSEAFQLAAAEPQQAQPAAQTASEQDKPIPEVKTELAETEPAKKEHGIIPSWMPSWLGGAKETPEMPEAKAATPQLSSVPESPEALERIKAEQNANTAGLQQDHAQAQANKQALDAEPSELEKAGLVAHYDDEGGKPIPVSPEAHPAAAHVIDPVVVAPSADAPVELGHASDPAITQAQTAESEPKAPDESPYSWTSWSRQQQASEQPQPQEALTEPQQQAQVQQPVSQTEDKPSVAAPMDAPAASQAAAAAELPQPPQPQLATPPAPQALTTPPLLAAPDLPPLALQPQPQQVQILDKPGSDMPQQDSEKAQQVDATSASEPVPEQAADQPEAKPDSKPWYSRLFSSSREQEAPEPVQDDSAAAAVQSETPAQEVQAAAPEPVKETMQEPVSQAAAPAQPEPQQTMQAPAVQPLPQLVAEPAPVAPVSEAAAPAAGERAPAALPSPQILQQVKVLPASRYSERQRQYQHNTADY